MSKLIIRTSFSLKLRHRKTLLIHLILISFLILLLHLHYRTALPKKSDSYKRNVKEVYATLLCPPTPNPALKNKTDYYFEATRILTYRLLHKPSTKDLHNRSLIVLATEGVLQEQVRQLRRDGATVKTVPAIKPPKGVDLNKTFSRWKNQYTKLMFWNMTEYSKILYMDSDILPIRQLSAVFDTPLSIDKDGHPYLFAAVYDSMKIRNFGKFTHPIPVLGPDDTSAGTMFNAGLFFIHPSEQQATYLQSIYDNPPQGQDFTKYMEQSMLKYAYRNEGNYHWTRLSQMYNTQWPRLQDIKASYALHDKFWREDSPVAWDLRKYWYVAWGEMQGWSEERERTKNLKI